MECKYFAFDGQRPGWARTKTKEDYKITISCSSRKLPDCRLFQAREHVVKRQLGAKQKASDLFGVSRVATANVQMNEGRAGWW